MQVESRAVAYTVPSRLDMYLLEEGGSLDIDRLWAGAVEAIHPFGSEIDGGVGLIP